MRNKIIPVTALILLLSVGASAYERFDHKNDNLKDYYKSKLLNPTKQQLKLANKDFKTFAKTTLKPHAREIIKKLEISAKEFKSDSLLREKVYKKLESTGVGEVFSRSYQLKFRLKTEKQCGALDSLSNSSRLFLNSVDAIENYIAAYHSSEMTILSVDSNEEYIFTYPSSKETFLIDQMFKFIPEKIEAPIVFEYIQFFMDAFLKLSCDSAHTDGSTANKAVDYLAYKLNHDLSKKKASIIFTAIYKALDTEYSQLDTPALMFRNHPEFLTRSEGDQFFNKIFKKKLRINNSGPKTIVRIDYSLWIKNWKYMPNRDQYSVKNEMPTEIGNRLVQYIENIKASQPYNKPVCLQISTWDKKDYKYVLEDLSSMMD
ncbi:MAG: hypothetical protein P0S95_01710 [Rhabdochlamydiaceae bacterium]|nr:hypothetical protein [Candidatus Amphrikana amoebophyrae]